METIFYDVMSPTATWIDMSTLFLRSTYLFTQETSPSVSSRDGAPPYEVGHGPKGGDGYVLPREGRCF